MLLHRSSALLCMAVAVLTIGCGADGNDDTNGPDEPEHLIFVGSGTTDGNQRLYTMDSDHPAAATTVNLSPIRVVFSTLIKGVVRLPTTGKVLLLSSQDLFDVDTATGATTLHGPGSEYQFYLGGVAYDPNAGLIRVFNYTHTSFSIDPESGTRSDDGPAAVYAEGDLYSGDTLDINSMAYGATNGVNGKPLFAIDTGRDMLVRSDDVASGIFHSVGYLYLNADIRGFAISSRNVGYLVAFPHTGGLNLYRINLTTGEATDLGPTNMLIGGGMAIVEER